MQLARPCAIPLEYMPNPDGDNRLDVDIRESETCVTYFSSSRAIGGARYIRIAFTNCYAVRFVVTEEHEKNCPGFTDLDSDFAEICDSLWLQGLPAYVQSLKHFAFGINHCFFECIAGGYRVEPCSKDVQG